MSMVVGYKPYTGEINTNSARYKRAKAMYDEGHTIGIYEITVLIKKSHIITNECFFICLKWIFKLKIKVIIFLPKHLLKHFQVLQILFSFCFRSSI